jgi:hypothetical protein
VKVWPLYTPATVQTCPHCVGLTTDCCVCEGARTVLDSSYLARWAWHYHGCGCGTCRHLAGRYYAITGKRRGGTRPQIGQEAVA